MGCVPEDHILPLTIWSRGNIQHKISCIALSPDLKQLVTGSWDGNFVIWAWDQATHTLLSSWIVTGQGSAVSAIACFNNFFIACLHNGTICHFQLPSGHLLLRNQDSSYLHTTAMVLDESRIICAGYYPDLVVIDGYTLEVTAVLSSRIQSDWIACLKTSTRESGIHVQGITVSGVFKTWLLNDIEGGVGLESHSSPLNVINCLAMAFDMKRRYTLLVTCKQIKVFDYNVSIIFQHDSQFSLEGGDFFGKGIVIWTKRGDLYYFDVSGKQQDMKKLVQLGGFETYVPRNHLVRSNGNVYYIVGDISGFLSIWRLQKEPSVSAHFVCSADTSEVSKGTKGLLDFLNIRATCSVHITTLDKFIVGCSDGTLLVFPATELIMSHCFVEKNTDHWALIGHKKTVQCLLYPHSEQASFCEKLLVSGSDDFSVCFWDIFKRELLHRFCVHAGSILQLMVPPFEPNSRFSHAICSVSADHSVALLSYRERRCIFFASQHPFPIVAVRWKPSHDFMIVKCFDGSVFVWELKTGDLDRLLCGVAAEEVVFGCSDVNDDVLWDFYTKGPSIEDLKRKPLQMADSKDHGPVQLRGILSNPFMESYVLLINLSSLLLHLEAIFPSVIDEPDFSQHLYSLTVCSENPGLQKRLVNVLDAIKQEAGHLQERFHISLFRTLSKQKVTPDRKISAASSHQLQTWSQMILSFLHFWGKNSDLDKICLGSLGLFTPKLHVNFDLFSMHNVVSLRNPTDTALTRTWFDFVAMRALARTVRCLPLSEKSDIDPSIWEKVVSSNLPLVLTDFLSLERLAFIWQSSSITLRTAVHRVLPQYLLSLKKTDSLTLVEKWRMFLPTSTSPKDSLLASVAISLVGVLTIDGDIRSLHFDNVLETCESIRYAISTPSFNPSIQATAIDILGRGYLIWENALPVDETLILIFDRCAQCSNSLVHSSARETLRTVARNRMSQFVAYLKIMCKNASPSFENSKVEIISVLRGLLIELPWGLPCLLSDVIEVLLSCIEPSHLKTSELFSLLPGIEKVQQVHHSVPGQRVAVGMPDGKVVVHDLRTHRCHVFIAHSEAIRIVRFSSDGKALVTLGDSGMGSIWLLSHGFFDMGVGQFRFKLAKKFDLNLDPSEWESGIDIDWTDLRNINVLSVNSHSTLSTINISI